MTLRMNTRETLGLCTGLLLVWLVGSTLAQEPPAAKEPAQPSEPAASQPSSHPESQEGLQRLLKLRDQMQQQKHEKEQTGQTEGAPESSRPSRGGAHRPGPARPATVPSAPNGAQSRPQNLEELQRRARASTQRGAGAEQPGGTVPASDLIGPPLELSNDPPAGFEARSEQPPPPPAEPKPGDTQVQAAEPAPAEPAPEPRKARVRKPEADEETEWFNFVNMPWEQVVQQFVERIGKPLLQEDIVIGGELTYVSERRFTKPEAIDELNLILHEKGYRFIEELYHIYVVPLTEMTQHVDLKLVFSSVELFEAANPRDMDFVTVYYQIADHAAQLYVDMFNDALPDYCRLTALPDSNQIKIVALARDVRKFLTLKERISVEPSDPRVMRFFTIKTNALDIEQRVRTFLKIGGGATGMPQMQMIRDPKTGRMTPQPVPGGAPATGGGAESDVQLVADERTNSIIVKATKDKIDEISDLIDELDQKPDIGTFKTEVIEVRHGDATEIANLLNQVFQQEQGQAQIRTPNWQQQRMMQLQQQQQRLQQQGRRGQPVPPQPQMPQQQMGGAPEDIFTEGLFERAKKTVRLVADARMNALIVYANDDGMKRVREMLEVLDQQQMDKFRTFVLAHAKVADVTALVTQIVAGMSDMSGSGRGSPSIVPDDAKNALHVIAERDQMERIAQLITQFDVPGTEQQRHVIELKNLRPSDVAQMVQTLLGGGSGTAGARRSVAPTIRGRLGGGPAALTPSVAGTAESGTSYQVVALDEARVLIVMCSKKDWDKIEQTIQMWDERAVTSTPHLEAFTIAKGNPQTIAGTLATLYRTYQHPTLGPSTVTVQADGEKIWVYAIQPAIEEIGALVRTMDVENAANKAEILPLVNADAAQLQQQLQAMFVRQGPRGAGAAGPLIQAEPLTNSLIVQADKADLESIKDFAFKMDQKIGAQATEQRFFTMRFAQPQEVANTVQNIFASGPAGGRGPGGRAQVRAFAAGAQVVVEAPKEKFAAIETFIKQLDDPKGNEMQVQTVKLPGSDVTQVATTLTQTISSMPRPDKLQPKFIPDASTESIIISAPADLWPKINELVSQFAKSAEDLVLERKFYTIQQADAGYIAELLKTQLPPTVGAKQGQIVAARINIAVDAPHNTVIINAPRLVHPLADELIKSLDREPTGELSPVTMEVKYADPNQLVQTINALFGSSARPGLGQGQNKQQEVQALVSSGQLVVRAPKGKLEEVRKLVAELDTQNDGGLQIRTYSLKVLSAATVATQVQMYLRSILPVQRSGQMQPGAFAEPATNTLVVLAPAEQLPFIDGLITKLESAERPESGAQAYVLKNARADQVATNLDMMLKAKVIEREGEAGKNRVAASVVADASGNRLFVYAPRQYQELAAQLIQIVDEEVVSGEIVHIVPLERGDATQFSTSLTQVLQSAGARGGATARVKIVADAGSNSILLSGLPRDVADAEKLISELEESSVSIPELQLFKLEYAATHEVKAAIDGIFGKTKGPADAVTVTEDDYNSRIMVTANRRKMRQVEAVIQQLDVAPEEAEEGVLAGGREIHFVDVYRGKASDVLWEIRGLLPDEDKGGPSIDSDWFDQYLIVKCRPAEFPRIEKLIREFESRVKVETTVATRKVRIPSANVVEYLQARGDNIAVQVLPTQKKESIVEPLRPEGDEPDSIRQKREKNDRERSDASGRRVLPFEPGLPLTELLLDDVERELYGQPPARRAPLATLERDLRGVPGSLGLVRVAAIATEIEGDEPPEKSPATPARSAVPEPTPRPPQRPAATSEPLREREKVQVSVQPDGTIMLQGPRDEVDKINRSIDLLEEDLAVGEVIRIFQFKYGDVSAAADVLNIMFNERQMIIPAQQPQQPQRGQQPGQPGKAGEENKGQQGGLMDQLRGMVGGQQQPGRRGASGGQRLRIATDPGHNYLVIKCDAADLPDIRELLRELDIPPGEVQIKIFQLKNLAAEETAQNISDVLGISKAQQRRGAGRAQPGRQPAGGPQQQQQLMEMLQQQLVSVPGVEGGAKVERVEIVPNAVTNSLLVSAPPEVMSLIETVINKLEDLEGREVVGIYYYALQKARVDDVLPLLQEVFASATGGGGGGGGGGGPMGALRQLRGGGGSAGQPGALGPVTVSADPRYNTLIYSCQTKDQDTVEKHIKMLDREGTVAAADMYICQYGDAEAIASTVEAIYATGGGGGALSRLQPGGQRGATASGGDVRIVAEATTNSIFVWAPPDKRILILGKIAELDTLNQRQIREIPIAHTDPVKLATTLTEVFAGGGGSAQSLGRRGRGSQGGAPGQGGSLVTNTGRIMILGDKSAKKLLVRAPDEVYEQILTLVDTLDQPSDQMRLKRFPLKFADAEGVVETVRQAMTEYLQIAKTTGTETDFDAFTAVPDTRTNSVMVVGSEKTFLFVQQVLAGIDLETPADQKKEFRIFALEKADAVTVADAINQFAAGGASAGGGARKTGGRGGAPSTPAGPGRELNVAAVAEESTNSVMVIGRREDIEIVEVAVIEKLEDSISDRYRIETIAVEYVVPSQIVGFIWQFIDQGATATGGGARRAGGPARDQQSGPQIVPNDTDKTLVVRGTKRQVDEVRELVTRFDSPDFSGDTVRVIEVPLGQDATRLATEVERLINQSEKLAEETTGRRARQVTIAAEPYTNSIVVAGDSSMFGMVQNIVDQLKDIRHDNVVTRVIQLKNFSAPDAQKLIDDLQGRKGAGSGSSGRPAGSGSSTGGGMRSSPGGGQRSPSTPPTRPPAPRPSTPRPSTPRAPAGGGGGGKGGALRPGGAPTWMTPFVALLPMAPQASLLVRATWDPDQEEEQPTTRPATRDEVLNRLKGLQKPALDKAAAEKKQAAPQRPEPPPAQPALGAEELPALTGVSGTLRGEVTARALDSQQIIITGDENDVQFIESLLSMMESSSLPAVIEVFRLEKAKATVLGPALEKAMKAQVEIRTSQPGPQDKFSINAEAKSNSLIVAASEMMMEKIRDLVTQLDVEKGGGTGVKSVVLENIRAAEAVAILKPTVEKLNKMRDVPADSQATIEPIDRNNSVMILGTPADMDEIETWLQAIDVEISADQKAKQKSFVRADAILIQLKNGQAEDVAKVINDMIKAELDAAASTAGGDKKAAGKPIVKTIKLHMPDGTELPELQLDYPIRLVPEKGTNSLIIFSTPDNNEALKAIVGLFDSLPVGADTDVKVFALQHAPAEEISKLLTDVFKDKSYLSRPSEGDAKGLQKGILPPVPPGAAAKGLPYPLVVQHDPRSNTVIIVGRKDAVLLAAGLITELDRATVDLGLKAHVLQLKSAQVAQLSDKLKKMMDDRSKALHGDKNAARDSVVLYPDERSNRLVILASDDVYDIVEDLVLQLDAAEKYSVVDVRYRALKHADALKLKGMLDETFKSKKDAEKSANKDSTDTLSVLGDPRSNSLLLTGTRDYLEEAERLIEQLDQQYDGTVIFKARKVKLNSAPNVASLLKDMVDKALTQKDSKLSGAAIHVAADPVSDSLLMAASGEDMDVLDRWVDILDRPSEVGRMTRIIPLQRAVADDVAKNVQDMFKKSGGGQKSGEMDVAVAADKLTNSIVAFGPPALLKDVELFVKQLDSVEPKKNAIVRIFKLDQADAEKAGDLIQRILDLRGGSVGGTGGGGGSSGSGPKDTEKQVMLVFQSQHPELGLETLKALRAEVVVISDLRTNSLVVTAPADSMPLMESLIAAVDVPPETAKIRVFRLRNSDAEQTVKTLQDIFAQKTGTSSGGRTGGAAGDGGRVLTLAEGGEGGREEIALTSDVRTNSVIAAGTPGYLALVEQLILEIDTIPIHERETFVYAPKNITAEKMVPSIKAFSDAEQKRLQDIGKDVSVGVKQERQITAIDNKDANRIILDVDPRFKDSVMSVVRELDHSPPQVMIQVLVVEVTMDNDLDLGVEFAFQDLQFAKAGPKDTTTFDYVGGTDLGAAGSGLGGFSFTITGADFNFLFRTLQNEGNLNVLSRPQIVATDNQEASIDVSNDVPYVTGTSTTTGGQITTSVSRQKVGIKLTVTPRVNPDGFVQMELDQEVSDFSGSTVDVGQGVTAPVFFTREAKTTVSVKDNETVVIGGLITSRTENREQKIPIIGDIPGLGLLFRNQSDTIKRTELLVVLTPRVVRTVEDYRELSAAERDLMQAVPPEVLADPLMQGLRKMPEAVPEVNGGPVEPVGSETPADRQHEPLPGDEEYGPLRPALKPEPRGDPDSYDVPVTWRGGRR